jgi:ribosomal protein S18 acetylase RimI-like enzyme
MINYRLATEADAEGKGFVHYQSWIETYTGLMDQRILDSRSLEKCVKLARNFPENTWIALEEDQVVGFSCYMASGDSDLKDTGEVRALYVLKSHQKRGIGKMLMNHAMDALEQYKDISVWVLSSNIHAIEFYRKMGFAEDGSSKDVQIGNFGNIHEIRMIKHHR